MVRLDGFQLSKILQDTRRMALCMQFKRQWRLTSHSNWLFQRLWTVGLSRPSRLFSLTTERRVTERPAAKAGSLHPLITTPIVFDQRE